MINALAIAITQCLIKNEVADAKNEDFYIYGIKLIVEKVITYSVLFFLALYFKVLIPSILFITFFVLLRGYTGGYHANSFISCFISTILMYLFCSQILSPFLIKKQYILIIGLLLATIVIFALSPINHPNLDMDSHEIKECKKMGRLVLFIETVLIILGISFNVNGLYVTHSFLGMAMCAMLLIVAKIKKQEVRDYGEKS